MAEIIDFRISHMIPAEPGWRAGYYYSDTQTVKFYPIVAWVVMKFKEYDDEIPTDHLDAVVVLGQEIVCVSQDCDWDLDTYAVGFFAPGEIPNISELIESGKNAFENHWRWEEKRSKKNG